MARGAAFESEQCADHLHARRSPVRAGGGRRTSLRISPPELAPLYRGSDIFAQNIASIGSGSDRFALLSVTPASHLCKGVTLSRRGKSARMRDSSRCALN